MPGSKLIDLAAVTPALTDLVYVVQDPDGTPVDKQTTVGDLLALGGGALVFLQQQTASASADLQFTACFSSLYDEYEIHVSALLPATNGTSLVLEMSSDGGSTWIAANYRQTWHYVGPAAHGAVGSMGTTSILLGDTVSNTATKGTHTILRLFNPQSTTTHKHYQGRSSQHSSADANLYNLEFSGDLTDLSVINAFRIRALSGNLTSGSVRVYGVAKSGSASGAGSGAIVQVQNYQTGAVATGTTLIPFDDTVPTSSEGDQFMSLAFSPVSATNKLKIDVTVQGANSVQGLITVALFQDAGASALAAGWFAFNAATAPGATTFTHYMVAGTTSPTTFKVRVGGNNAGTFTFNGQNGGRIYGGTLASSITITEIVP